ncbi:MAG: RecX family transcriptional regulator [Bryobacteraceae bacterium]|jgi:regulatory protein
MHEPKQRRLGAEALWEYALRALGARAHSAGELRQKLLNRAQCPSDVPPILARLKERGYLDDRRYAEAYSASRLENEGWGKARVLGDLRKRRVAPALAEKAVATAYRDTDEVALIEAFLRRKFRRVALEAHLAEPKHLAAAYRRLRMAGFSSGDSLRVLKRLAKEPELLDALESEEEAGEPGPSL